MVGRPTWFQGLDWKARIRTYVVRRVVLIPLLCGALATFGFAIGGYVRYLALVTTNAWNPGGRWLRFESGASPDMRTTYFPVTHPLFSQHTARGSDPTLAPPGWRAPTLVPPRWAEEDKWPGLEPGDRPGQRTVLAVGFPFRAFTGCLEYKPWVRGPPSPPVAWAPGPSAEHDAWVRSQRASEPDWSVYTIRRGSNVYHMPWVWLDLYSPNHDHAVPTHILPGPFLANWLIWSLASLALLAMLRAPKIVRRELRRRRGCCPACGYSLRMLRPDAGVCPECGSPINIARTPPAP